ncbi:MAG: sigma-54-dependent Fis family transcriptional regulator [Planctomycetes bacterium]|nr:sigma-54-dependent Fis family transcriptional regulator [Planctomycetota bacterium]
MDETAFILIVEDEVEHGQAIAEGLRRSGHACHVVHDGPAAIASMKERPPDVVVTDYRLGGDTNGMDVLRAAKELCPDTEVILITAYGSEQLARDVLSRESQTKAYDYLIKPLDLEEVREKVQRAARQSLSNKENRHLREQLDRAFSFEGIIGSTEIMAKLIKKLRRVANSKITVLLIGETGTGKDLIAQAIHVNSSRSGKPYRAINCAGLNENLLESELFGHVKGAFTGAITDRKGIFEAADGGTLFLDEIGDMPLTMQAKLLRTLENGEFIPVGSDDVRIVDVRVIAATHQNLTEMIQQNTFREDLFYRLNQVQLAVPALRSRREDIPLLADHFLEQANKERQASGLENLTMDSEVLRKLTAFGWPGNVRQLQSVIGAMVVQADDPVITVDDLPDAIRGSTEIVPLAPGGYTGLSMADVEKMHIANTLKLTSGNREKAAKMLGIGARTLYRKLKEYELT